LVTAPGAKSRGEDGNELLEKLTGLVGRTVGVQEFANLQQASGR